MAVNWGIMSFGFVSITAVTAMPTSVQGMNCLGEKKNIYIYIFFLIFYYIIQTLDTNHSLLRSEWKVRSEKWKLIQNKQTPTPTQTQTETAMRSLPGGKSS